MMRSQRRQMERENARQPAVLTPVSDWKDRGDLPAGLIEVWRSREFLVQIYAESPGIIRASINRVSFDSGNDRWVDGISWEELQRVKREIGRANLDAVEVFPADRDIVNVANMRHLFIMDEPLPFVWRRHAVPSKFTEEEYREQKRIYR